MLMQVNAFFHGNKLSLMEKLTVHSFLNNNCKFKLFSYDKSFCDIKHDNFELIDANEILDQKHFFTYTGNGDCPANSVGGFSDIFRFKILQQLPGWYVDMDVTCLRSFDELADRPTVFRPSERYGAVANVIKCNNRHFIDDVLQEYHKSINASNNDWVKPLDIFYDTIKKHQLQECIVNKTHFGDDSSKDVMDYIDKNVYELSFIPEYAIHWCNTACTTANWNKRLRVDWNVPRPASLYYCLLEKYGLIK